MTDAAVAALAIAAAAGALVGSPLPLALPLVAGSVALAWRRPFLLVVAVALATSALAARSEAGLRPPLTGRFEGTVTLAGDPQRTPYGTTRVVVRIDGKRVEAEARGPAAWRLEPRLAGDRVRLTGTVAPVPARLRSRLAPRHVAARIAVREVGEWDPGGVPARIANGLRRTLLRGARSLPDEHRALFAGFVLGDDREQAPDVVDDFRGSGLTHLLAVSGQNVAFVLALAAPILMRLGLRSRFAFALAVLALFGTMTRWEPSVLRAAAMAALALLAALRGRPQSGLRLLALAVAGLLLVDPLLVRSVGFLLSVGASAGILVLGPRFVAALPGPRGPAMALGITAAAQVGVAPVLVPVFGGLPVASIPANLLALPAAGPVMAWGIAAGLPAGVVGGPVAALLHLPDRVLIGWVATVARLGSRLPLGELRTPHLVALVGVVALARVPRLRRAAVVAAGAVMLTPALTAPPAAPLPGAQLTGRVLVVDQVQVRPLLEGLRRRRVGSLDEIVLRRPTKTARRDILVILRRHPARRLVLGTNSERNMHP